MHTLTQEMVRVSVNERLAEAERNRRGNQLRRSRRLTRKAEHAVRQARVAAQSL